MGNWKQKNFTQEIERKPHLRSQHFGLPVLALGGRGCQSTRHTVNSSQPKIVWRVDRYNNSSYYYAHLFTWIICPSSTPHSFISFNASFVHIHRANTFTWQRNTIEEILWTIANVPYVTSLR